MNEIKHLPKSVPAKGHTFSLKEVKGDTTGEDYRGDFACIIPNNRISAKIARDKALMNGGLDASLDQQTKNLHHMVAYCKNVLTKAPDWFKESDFGYDLYDLNVLESVYFTILKKEEEWLSTIWGKDKEEEKAE
jgi:hypothetical protein